MTQADVLVINKVRSGGQLGSVTLSQALSPTSSHRPPRPTPLHHFTQVDLAEAVGADLDVMESDAKRMRGDGPTVSFSLARAPI